MQRPQGQYDDLAGLPRTRSGQSGHRRSPAARTWSCPSLRLPGRVVASVPDTRPSKPLAASPCLLAAFRSRSIRPARRSCTTLMVPCCSRLRYNAVCRSTRSAAPPRAIPRDLAAVPERGATMITKECFGCEKVTSHEHLHDCAPGIPETHIVGSERFVYLLCKHVTFPGSDGASRFPFTFDKVAAGRYFGSPV